MPPRRRVAPQSSSSGESSSDDAADAPKRGGSQADSENSNELCSLKRCQGPKGCICPDKRKSPSKFAILPNISPGKSNAATGRGAKARMKVKASGGGSSSDSSSSEEGAYFASCLLQARPSWKNILFFSTSFLTLLYIHVVVDDEQPL